MVTLSDTGTQAIENAPTLLQESFVKSFVEIKQWEQTLILSSLQRIASMMQASDLEAAPVLDSSEERLVNAETMDNI